MRKFSRILFVFALVTCVLLAAGCKKTETSGSSGSGGTLAKGDVTFSMFYFGGINPNTTSLAYEDNAFTKRIVDETGIKLDISSMSAADSPQRLNVMLNSGDYPDIIFGRNLP